MKKSVVVFGLGVFGKSLASKLYDLGLEVMAVDKDYDLVEDMKNDVSIAVQCDFLDEDAMEELGISNFDVAVVATGSNLEATIAALIFAKDKGVPKVISKANNIHQARILEKLGVDEIIFPEMDMGQRLARSIARSNILEYVHFSNDYALGEIKVKKDWLGKTIEDLDFRNAFNMNIIAVKRKSEYIISPGSRESIQDGDILITIGMQKEIDKLIDKGK